MAKRQMDRKVKLLVISPPAGVRRTGRDPWLDPGPGRAEGGHTV